MVTPKTVLALSEPAKGFLCRLSDNKYDVEFIAFSISDCETNEVLFDVSGDLAETVGSFEFDIDASNSPVTEDSFRKIKYTFSERVLKLPLIKTSLTFKVGDKPLSNFRMIERHYFKDKLIKSYDFNFGFCIPGSTNNWEAVYDIPKLEDGVIEKMINEPFETQSDSFYFVGDELIMHNKASYRYVMEEETLLKLCQNAEPKDIVGDIGNSNKPLAKQVIYAYNEQDATNDVDCNLSQTFCEAKLNDSFDSLSESKQSTYTRHVDNCWMTDTQFESKYDM